MRAGGSFYVSIAGRHGGRCELISFKSSRMVQIYLLVSIVVL